MMTAFTHVAAVAFVGLADARLTDAKGSREYTCLILSFSCPALRQ